MKSVVFLKLVPDTETLIKIGPDGRSINTEGVKWVMNPYDEFGLEEALRLKDKFGGEVLAISLGPKKASEIVRQALAMGADRGILIEDEAAGGSDALATSKALVAAIGDFDFDLIFTGQRGIDEDAGLVGAYVAELLDIPQLSIIRKVEMSEDGNSVKVHRPVEGRTLIIEAELPALITAQKGLNEPRYATLPSIMKAKKKPLDQKTLADFGLDPGEFGEQASKITVLKMTKPPARPEVTMVQGETPQEQAVEAARLLHEEAKVF
jgi:electron transfer flavoprotein beta subunit